MQSISEEEVKKIIESAFQPYRCVAEIWDYGQKIRFKVFDKKGNGIFERRRIILREVSDKKRLENFLMAIKNEIEKQGIKLDPWP